MNYNFTCILDRLSLLVDLTFFNFLTPTVILLPINQHIPKYKFLLTSSNLHTFTISLSALHYYQFYVLSPYSPHAHFICHKSPIPIHSSIKILFTLSCFLFPLFILLNYSFFFSPAYATFSHPFSLFIHFHKLSF